MLVQYLFIKIILILFHLFHKYNYYFGCYRNFTNINIFNLCSNGIAQRLLLSLLFQQRKINFHSATYQQVGKPFGSGVPAPNNLCCKNHFPHIIYKEKKGHNYPKQSLDITVESGFNGSLKEQFLQQMLTDLKELSQKPWKSLGTFRELERSTPFSFYH